MSCISPTVAPRAGIRLRCHDRHKSFSQCIYDQKPETDTDTRPHRHTDTETQRLGDPNGFLVHRLNHSAKDGAKGTARGGGKKWNERGERGKKKNERRKGEKEKIHRNIRKIQLKVLSCQMLYHKNHYLFSYYCYIRYLFIILLFHYYWHSTIIF